MKKKINTSLISLYDIENNAVRCVAAILRKNDFRVFEIYFKNWVNNCLVQPKDNELDKLIGYLRKTNTDLVGISLRASAYFEIAKLITKKIKKALNIPVFWGGLHPTLAPEECIEIADIVCVGEGEYPTLELVSNMSEHRPIEMIPNLWIKKENDIQRNEIRHLVENLDELPFRNYGNEDRVYIENGRIKPGDPLIKRSVLDIMASRGCVYSCSYCYNSALKNIYKHKGKYFRYRSVDNLISELSQAKKTFKNLKYIRFDDEMFIFDNRWIKDFIREYKNKIGLPFECFLRPNNYSIELLRELKQAGLRVVYMGIEGPEKINKILYKREIYEKDILINAKVFHELKIDMRYQVILDDPVSDEEDKKNFFNFLMTLPRPFELYLFSLTFFPKTELTEKFLKEGVITDDDIEGKATKTFSQLRVDLNFSRSKPDQFWISLIVLMSKNFIPKGFIYRLSRSKFLYKHPGPLIIFSQICNVIKMAGVVLKMILKGKMHFYLFKQWLNPKSIITQ